MPKGLREMGGRERLTQRPGGYHLTGTQDEGAREGWKDFFDMVRDEDHSRRVLQTGEGPDKIKKTHPRQRIQSGAGLVQNEEARAGHERAAYQDSLTFPLGEKQPMAIRQLLRMDIPQDSHRFLTFGAGDPLPGIEERMASAGHNLEGGFRRLDLLGKIRADKANPLAEFPPV